MTSFSKKKAIERLKQVVIDRSFLKAGCLSLTFVFLFFFKVRVAREEPVIGSPPGRTPAFDFSPPVSVAASTSSQPVRITSLKRNGLSPVRIDITTASLGEIEALPGIGPVLAARIIESREQRGSFRRAEDLLQVKGIGPKKLEKIKPYLTFPSPGPSP
ncbi:MAG: helix-hairpin-helix domain-containing protein [Candidatus Manganitrophaceae bacterium]